MTVRKNNNTADDYAVEDVLFTKTLHYMAKQSIPNVWRTTRRRAVLARIKQALLGYSPHSPTQHKQEMQHTGTEPITVLRWLM